jgi:hypothetical protein
MVPAGTGSIVKSSINGILGKTLTQNILQRTEQFWFSVVVRTTMTHSKTTVRF